MDFNELFVSDSKKNKSWIKKLIQHYVDMDGGYGGELKRDERCWSLFFNEMNANRFDYLLEVGKFSLPAKPRHIPLQKHLIDSLTSQQAHRPFVFSTITINNDAAKEKSFKTLRAIINDLSIIVKDKHYNNIKKLTAMEQKMQQLREMTQQEPQSEEDMMVIRQIQNALPYIEIESNSMKEELEAEDRLDTKQVAQFRRYYSYNFKDYKEELAQKLIWKLRNELGIRNKSIMNFTSHVVTGRQYYYVDYIEGEKWPRFDILETTKVRYPRIPGIRWVQDGPWVKVKEKMSFQQVNKEFGKEIIKEYGMSKLEELSKEANYNSSNDGRWVSTPEGAMHMSGFYQGTFENGSGIDVERVFVKVPRKVHVKYSPNKHEKGKYFRHFITDDRKPINEDDYNYNKGSFTSKKDKEKVYKKSDVVPYRGSRGEYVLDYEVNDIYEGACINNDIYVSLRKKKAVLRNIDSYRDIKLPVVGKTFSNISEQPYSLIWTTKDLQELYDIVYTMRELMVALSGTKTIVYDVSQKPGEMDDDEFEYQKKKGMIAIETVDPATGASKRTPYNQWQLIDMSLTQSVQYLDNMLLQLEEAMGNIIGVPRQRQGQVVNTDQVGTFKESIQRAQLITEILFQQHDEIEAKALTQLLNLTIRYSVKEGDEFEVNDKEMGRDFFRIPKSLLQDLQFDVMVADNTEHQRKMQELREFLIMGYKDKALPFSAFLQAWDSDTMVSMKNKVMDFVEQAEEIEQLNRDRDRESAERIKASEQEFKAKLTQFSEETKKQIQEMKSQVEMEKARIEEASKERDREVENKKIDMDARLKFMELMNEQASETAVLRNNDKHATMGERINLLELQLNNLFNIASLNSQHEIGKKKVEVEDKKARKIVKEHVSDK